MRPVELAPGLWRWTAPHPDWRPGAAPGSSADWPQEVGCVLLRTERDAVFIDALPGQEEAAFWRWADEQAAGRRVLALTTIAFHRRGRELLVQRYGAGTSRARGKLPAEVRPIPLRGAGETVFWLPGQRTLVPGDRLIGGAGGGLRVCPAPWLRYLPSRIGIEELRALLRPLLELPVERVLVSHGEPVLAGGRAALAEALE